MNRKKYKIALTLSIFLLGGCASTAPQQITTPNGKKGFVVECNGSANTWALCYESAKTACPSTYKIIDRSETSTPTPYGPLVKRNFVIECN